MVTKFYKCVNCGLEVQIVMKEDVEITIAECEICGINSLRQQRDRIGRLEKQLEKAIETINNMQLGAQGQSKNPRK